MRFKWWWVHPSGDAGGYVRSMRLHRSRVRRAPIGESYNEQFGPAGPYCRGPCLAGEWDDPTWIAVEVDEEYMAARAARLDLYAQQALKAQQGRVKRRKRVR